MSQASFMEKTPVLGGAASGVAAAMEATVTDGDQDRQLDICEHMNITADGVRFITRTSVDVGSEITAVVGEPGAPRGKITLETLGCRMVETGLFEIRARLAAGCIPAKLVFCF